MKAVQRLLVRVLPWILAPLLAGCTGFHEPVHNYQGEGEDRHTQPYVTELPEGAWVALRLHDGELIHGMFVAVEGDTIVLKKGKRWTIAGRTTRRIPHAEVETMWTHGSSGVRGPVPGFLIGFWGPVLLIIALVALN